MTTQRIPFLVLLGSAWVPSLPAAEPATLPLLLLPLLAEYDALEKYFRQPVANHPRYAAIEAYVHCEQPLDLCVVLTPPGEGARETYCISEERVRQLNAEGRVAHRTAIDFKSVPGGPDRPDGYGFGFGFRDQSGTAILWRFLPATDPSDWAKAKRIRTSLETGSGSCSVVSVELPR